MSPLAPHATPDSAPRHLTVRLLCGAALGATAAGLVGLAAGMAPVAAIVGAPAGLALVVLLGAGAQSSPS